MSSIKDLFKKHSNTTLENKSLEDVATEVESVGYIKDYLTKKNRFLPHVDFSSASNFVRYGSAEKYYDDSINRILKNYPYDGSRQEKLEWENNSSGVDLYIFNNEYPRTTGYITLGGNPSTGYTIDSAQPGNPTDKEYIIFYGGPHTASDGVAIKPLYKTFSGSNVWSPTQNQESNLKFDLSSGATMEFWVKFGDLDPDTTTQTQVLFDLSNAQLSGSDSASPYGRFYVYYYNNGSAADSGLKASLQSGSVATSTMLYSISDGLTLANTGSWNHYAITVANSGTDLVYQVYENGTIVNTVTETDQAVNEVTGALMATVGALNSAAYTTPGVTTGSIGWYKTSGSIDEFRYWKTKRNAQQIGRHWFSQVGGGTNSDTANTQLGVYYKFNEGITGDSSADSVVLDFSGRISNGTFAGYETSYSRNTGSALIESSASAIEFEDPIIYADHPRVVSLRTKLLTTGSVYDYSNPASLYNTIPAWIVEEDSGAIKNLTQVISSFFDNMHLQMEALPAIRENVLYTSASAKPLPFGKELLESVGLVAPEMFVDADIIEKLAGRNDEKVFADDIYNVKNRIYENIYNNLVYIYKSKGTEKSFRNLIRCYGIDREVVDLKVYGSDITYKIRDNRSAGSTRKKYADFYHPDRFSSVVYQQTASSNTNSVPFITGSAHLTGGWGMTFEAEAIFPAPKKLSETNYFINDFATASIFGIHTVKQTTDSETGAEVAWNTPDVANFQVLAAKDYTAGSEDVSDGRVRFILTGSAGGFFHPALTSSGYPGVYENQRWNFAVKIGPSSYPLSSEVSGTLPGRDNQPYKVEFYGVNLNYNQIENEFYLTASMDGDYAKQFMSSSKRVFVGANKTDFLGGALQRSDAKISSARAWLDVLDNTTVLAHAKDPTSFGAAHPYRNAYVFQDYTGSYLPSIETLLLNWDFTTVTGSDAGDGGSGYTAGFAVPDMSSGSVTDIPGGTSTYGWLGPILRSQHTGRGEDYLANQTDVVDTQFLYASKQTLPEYVDSSEMVNILSQDDVNFTLDSRPTNYYFSIEKSMYEAISRQMVDFFATIKDFNNLIGDPVNRYRQEYKTLGKLRQLFFEGVSNDTIDFEKYLEYYKWIDSSLTLMLIQMIPASAKFSEGVRTMVESHVLERNKYWNKFPTLESKFSDPEDAARGINELLYNWKRGHAPISGLATDDCFWWKERAERTISAISASGNPAVNENRTEYLSASLQVLNRRLDSPYKFSAVEIRNIKSGQNSQLNTKEKAPFGSFGILNEYSASLYHSYTEITASELEQDPVCTDVIAPTYTRLVEDGNAEVADSLRRVSYSAHTGSDVAGAPTNIIKDGTPLTLYSSSVETGYVKELQDIVGFEGMNVTNIHNDSYGPDHEIPLQGPFTEKYVGGYQYRHVEPNYRKPEKDYLDNQYTRPEGYRVLMPGVVGGQPNSLVIGGPAMARSGTLSGSADFSNTAGAASGGKGYTATTSANLDISDDFTISMWVRTSTDLTSHSPGAVLLQVLSSTYANRLWFFIDENNYPSVSTNSAPRLQAAVAINDDEWHHICFTYEDDANDWNFYLDGDHHDDTSYSLYGWDVVGDIINIGVDYDAGPVYNNAYTGYMADVALFNVEYTAEQVGKLYSGSLPYSDNVGTVDLSHRPGLQAWWKLGGSLTTDSSGQGNTLTAINSGVDPSSESPPTQISADPQFRFRPFANRMRETYAKRPVNIANIQQVTSSGITKIGNFDQNYQVVQTSGRRINNLSIENLSIASSGSSYVTGVIDYSLPTRTTNKSVFVERFSAPGSSEVLARGTRDYTSEEYSPYNALPWRNLTVRQPLNSMLSQHSAQFGLKPHSVSGSGQLDNPLSHTTASYQKTNRNTRRQYEKDARYGNHYSVYFDGAGDFYRSYQNALGLELQDSSFSAFAWVKFPTDLALSEDGTIISFGANDPTFDIRLAVKETSFAASYLYAESYSGVYDVFSTSANSIVPGQWHHVGLTCRYNGNGGITTGSLYIDGTLHASSATSSFSASLWASSSIGIGNEDTYVQTYDFRGLISEVAVWNTELTGTAISQLYKFGSNMPGPCDLNLHPASASLVTWYRMGDEDPQAFGSGMEATILRDSSQKQSDATLYSDSINNPVLVMDAPPGSYTPYPGKFEALKITKSGVFNGTTTVVISDAATTSGALQMASNFTLSMWIKPETPVGDYGMILNINSGSPDDKMVLFIRASDGKLCLDENNEASPESVSSYSLVDGDWHHVAFTYDYALDDALVYIDGVLDNTSPSINMISVASNKLYFGATLATSDPSYSNFYKGEMAEICVFSGLLTADEIGQLYRYTNQTNYLAGPVNPYNLSSSMGNSGSLKAWWRFGETPGSTSTAIVDAGTGSWGLVASNLGIGNTSLTASNRISATRGTAVYDNYFAQHMIPQSDTQYLWITSSLENSKALGYATASDDITFASSSEYGYMMDDDSSPAGPDNIGIYMEAHAGSLAYGAQWKPIDFVGLNTIYMEPVTASSNTLGYDPTIMIDVNETGYLGAYLNTRQNHSLRPAFLTNINQASLPLLGYFHGLLEHRGDAYGFNTWRQIRAGSNPIARLHRRENQLSVLPIARQTVEQFGNNYDHKYNADSRRNDFEARSTYVFNATQSMVTSKYKPLIHEMGPQDSQNEIILTDTFSNQMETFNEQINSALYTYLLPRDVDEVHTNIMDATKNGYMPPENALRKFTYQETIFPRGKNTFLAKVRQREAFIVDFWHPLSASRLQENVVNSQGFTVNNQSMWVLDARYNSQVSGAADAPSTLGRAGELQNRYSIGYGSCSGPGTASSHFALGISYNRAGLPNSSAGTFIGLAGVPWTAGAEAGKNPFYFESYDAYAADIRVKAPDYTIVPEYRISDHMTYYITERNGDFEPRFFDRNRGMLSLTGAVLNNASPPTAVASSSMDGFFEEYSLTDMLKYFDVLEDINEGTDMNPTRLTLSCRAVKKFLPYNGFYPAQRTVQLATLFSQSYGPAVSCSGDHSLGPYSGGPTSDLRFRAALQPFFAPGILYNTIKSGLAVDWPIYTGSADFLTDPPHKDGAWGSSLNASGAYICHSASYRAPFETLLEPERVLNSLRDIEQQYIDVTHRAVLDPEINTSWIDATASIDGPYDSRYKMAMHNFLAETIDFFLKDSTLTSLVSLPDGDPNFGNTGNSNVDVFSMDVIVSQNILTGSTSAPIPGNALLTKQATLDAFPMMYNQYQGPVSLGGGQYQWTDFTGPAFGPPVNSSKVFGEVDTVNIANWQCFPFTPPHLYYPSLARLAFVPFRGAGEGQVYSLDEILSNMTVKYYHIDGLVDPVGSKQIGPAWTDGSQISASLNLSQNPSELVKVSAKDVTFGAVSRAPEVLSNSNSEVLVIQTRFETPILDFRSSSLTARGIYPQAPSTYTSAGSIVTRGMWHQYGAIPQGAQGIFLEIRDSIDADVYDQSLVQWGSLYNLETPPDRSAVTGSLVDLMGFKRGPERLGQAATEREIKEAVVAIPYQEGPGGAKNFYPIDILDAAFAIDMVDNNRTLTPSDHRFELFEQFRKMKEYVFPPQFNCLHFDGWRPMFVDRPGTVLPISMFIFEFKHTLTTLDVTDIWQNLPPSIHERMETATATISDNLLLKDLLQLQGQGPDRDIRNIKFMVFKVKQRGKMNYFRKTLDSADDSRFSYEQLFGRAGSSKDAEPPYSYNWPYDYFSLVELAKIDTVVEYSADQSRVINAVGSDVAGLIEGAVSYDGGVDE